MPPSRMGRWASIGCFFGVLATQWLPSKADPLVVSGSTFPVQALHGYKYPFSIDLELSWTGLPLSDYIYYSVSDVSASSTNKLKTVSAYNEDGTLINSLSVDGWAEGTGDRSFNVAIMTESDSSDVQYVEAKVFAIPPSLSLFPPIFIIILAVTTKSVLLSLMGGVYAASFIIYKYNIFQAFLRTWDVFIVPNTAKENNVQILFLSFLLSGMVGVVLKNGGGFGAAAAMSKIAKTRKNIAMATFLLGLLIMFHTYANALIIGQSMRPVTDLYLISREKLAFLVDSTSAPIASVSPVSSWIGYEMSLIDSILDYLVDQGEDISCYDQSSFVIFVKTIPTRYYPWGVLFIQCMCIVVEREFGPMLFAERRAKSGRGVAPPSDDQIGELDQALNPSPDAPLKWWMAFWPIVAVFTLTVFFLIYTGAQNAKAAGAARDIHNMFGYSESNLSLLYASFLASMLAFLMSRLIGYTKDGKVFPTVFTRWFSTEKVKPYLHFSESLWAWIEGMKGILSSMIILVLAWAVGASIQHANTGTFISSAAADGVNPKAFPAMCFCISGILSGITGTSWGTMAIMFPLVLPAAHFAAPCNRTIFYGTIASILSGAIFGDHISPLSDTTIISCVSTKCDVWAHVITQAPYAFLAGGIGITLGDIAVGFGLYPEAVGISLVILGCGVAVFFICVPVDGDKVDIFTLAYHKMGLFKGGIEMKHVSQSTTEHFTGGSEESLGMGDEGLLVSPRHDASTHKKKDSPA